MPGFDKALGGNVAGSLVVCAYRMHGVAGRVLVSKHDGYG